MAILGVTYSMVKGSYRYSLMGYDEKPSFLHIDDMKTQNNSVLVPLSAVIEIIPISMLIKEMNDEG